MSFYNSRYYKSSQKTQSRHEGERDASRKYEARIANLEQQLAEAKKANLRQRLEDLGSHFNGGPLHDDYTSKEIDDE